MCEFISERFYEGDLHSAGGCEPQRIDAGGAVSGAGLMLLEVEHAGRSQYSPEEAAVIAAACAEQHARPTLLLIEVKVNAKQFPWDYNPVTQVCDYRGALERQEAFSRWQIHPWVIAREISEPVKQDARAARVPCSLCDENGGRLRTVVGRPPV